MTDKELRRLTRSELLEMLIDQSTEVQALREKLAAAEAALQRRDIAINKAGSIAEASLQLNNVFESAQAACLQYTENIRQLSERQEAVCAKLEQESRAEAARLVSEAERKSMALEKETKIRCAEMCEKAKAESQAYWNEISDKLEAFYKEHAGLRELLAAMPPKQE